MPMLDSDIWAIRVLAGEGRYDVLRQLEQGRRFFIAAKIGITAFRYWRGRSEPITAKQIAFIKGANQERHHRHSKGMREKRVGQVAAVFETKPSQGGELFPRITTAELVRLVFLIAVFLVRARRRDLLKFYLLFYKAMNRIAKHDLHGVEVFICYNDQPFDAAGIVHALNRRGRCHTIVVQHGLILDPEFYFPVNANQFWAWGELSRQNFQARVSSAEMLVVGRYSNDDRNFAERAHVLAECETIRILAAFSCLHDEVLEGVRAIGLMRRNFLHKTCERMEFSIKLHPATKNRIRLKRILSIEAPWLKITSMDMEYCAEVFDALITVSSTSSIDFLLRGKTVFATVSEGIYEIGPTLKLSQIDALRGTPSIEWGSRRKDFLRDYINVLA
jgi:hypothetical protein